jgi:hypothetical protein
VFNVLFVRYSLAKNNLNNTYQYNMISKKFSKTMNYLIILIKFKDSRFLCRSVYNADGVENQKSSRQIRECIGGWRGVASVLFPAFATPV